MFDNYSKLQYFLTVILAGLAIIFVAQIGYTRQNQTEILDFIPKDYFYVAEFDIAAHSRSCLLGGFCFQTPRDNLSQDKLTALEKINTELVDIDLIAASSYLESRFYLISLPIQGEVSQVWLTRYSFIDHEAQNFFESLGKATKWQGHWLLVADSSESLDVLSSLGSRGITKDYWLMSINDPLNQRDQLVTGLINSQQRSRFLVDSDYPLVHEIESQLSQLPAMEDLYFSLWLVSDKLNFELKTQTLNKSRELVNPYRSLRLDSLFGLDVSSVINTTRVTAEVETPDLYGWQRFYQPDKYALVILTGVNEPIDWIQDEKIVILPRSEIDLIKNYRNYWSVEVAKKMPFSQELELPDGQIATELVARPQEFEFVTAELRNGYRLEYLSRSEINFDLALAYSFDKLIIGPNKEILENFIYSNETFLSRLWNDVGVQDQFYYRLEDSYGMGSSLLVEEADLPSGLWLRGVID